MSFPCYPAYKDSGVEWLGNLPAHWSVSKLGFESTVKARLGWKGLKAEEYVHIGHIFLSTPNIKGAKIDFEDVNYITDERYFESPEIMLQVGDVLVVKDGATLGIVNVVRALPGTATVNSSIAVIRPGNGIDSLYLYYFLSSNYIQQVIQRMKDGMGVPHLFQDDLRKFSLVLPLFNEQRAIAAFLDAETARIDALVAKQEALLATLQEKRRALISHAVTKGLDSAVPMKDSGVPWLGEVPAHWKVLPLRRCLYDIEQGWSPECEDRKKEHDEWGVLKTGCVNRGLFRESEHKTLPSNIEPRGEYEVCSGDVLMSRANGSIELLGSVALVETVQPKLMLSDKIYRLKPISEVVTNHFLVWAMNSQLIRVQIEQAVSGAEGLANNIAKSSVREFWIAIPPLDKQAKIALYLQEETARIDSLIAKAQAFIELLREHRTALIAAAVTGQIDVRGYEVVTRSLLHDEGN